MKTNVQIRFVLLLSVGQHDRFLKIQKAESDLRKYVGKSYCFLG